MSEFKKVSKKVSKRNKLHFKLKKTKKVLKKEY